MVVPGRTCARRREPGGDLGDVLREHVVVLVEVESILGEHGHRVDIEVGDLLETERLDVVDLHLQPLVGREARLDGGVVELLRTDADRHLAARRS